MKIRRAADSEQELLVDIWLRSVRATHEFLSEEEIQKLLPLVRDHALKSLELWVVADNNVVFGFMGLDGNKLEAIFLEPDRLRCGAGRALVAHARRLKGPLLVDVNEQNPEAVKFYEALGFVRDGRSEVDGMGMPYPLLHLRDVAARPPGG